MNIVWACTGEGFGHVARAVALIAELRERHRIFVLCPEPMHRFVRQHLSGIPIKSIPFFSMRKTGPRISYLGTVVDNAGLMARFQAEVQRVIGMLDAWDIEGVVSDYDPFAAHAGAATDRPVVQINHPAVVLRDGSPHPAAVTARGLAPFMMGPHDAQIICSFYEGDVGPIVRPDLLRLPATGGDRILVYAKPSFRTTVTRALEAAGVTGFDIFPDPRKNYLEAFARSRAVIAGAGHQTISEAIVMRKPILVVPQAGQYEQVLNGIMLHRSGRGTFARPETLDRDIREFVETLHRYPRPPESGYRFRLHDERVLAARRVETELLRHVVTAFPVAG